MLQHSLLFRLVRFGGPRPFSSAGVPAWERCTSVPELIGTLKDLHVLCDTSRTSLERKALELLSGDLREAAMLIITLKNFGCDVQGLLSRVVVRRTDCNLDLYFRALSECGILAPSTASSELSAAVEDAAEPRHVYNYLCGVCIFNPTGLSVDLVGLLKRLDVIGLSNFTPLQLLHMAGSLASVDVMSHSDVLDRLCDDIVARGVSCINVSDFLDGMSRLSKHYQHPGLFAAFEQSLLMHYSTCMLNSRDVCLALHTFSRYYRCSTLLMDRIAVNLRRDIGNYDLVQLSRVVIWLSKVGYYNKAIVVLLGRMVRTFLDEDSTADAQLLTNLYTGFSRFLYHDKLFDLFSTILRKEEVFANLQPCDGISIVQAYARIHVMDDRLFRLLDNKLFVRPLNTAFSVKLLVAHGKLRYRNPKLQHALLNNINLQELDSQIDREKLKLATERLCLFYPELNGGGDGDIPRVYWRRLDPGRRVLQHVRRRKWTW